MRVQERKQTFLTNLEVLFGCVIAVECVLVQLEHEVEVPQLPHLEFRSVLSVYHASPTGGPTKYGQ